MLLEAGTKLGTYEILAPLGAGGQGEVYRARDNKLQRDVAIKVLPAAVADDRETLSRFEREARLLAALNHPNIATLHGMEEAGGVHFLVMELVEGETLAERIAKGPVPLDETLPWIEQLIGGLEAAHENGVIHRDLKPSNVKIAPDGTVKLLDFGLAKESLRGDRASSTSQSPTLTRHTEPSVVMGTVAYMSPEQARGKAVDKRTDIWSFGTVLYELWTGRLAFEGDSVSDTIANVIKSEPEWQSLPLDLPQSWRTMLKSCLEKDPKDRLRDIGDLRLAFRSAFGADASPPRSRRKSPNLPWAVAGAATLVALAALVFRRPEHPVTPAARFAISVDGELPTRANTLLAISPDGREIVYAAVTDEGDQLYRRSTGRLDAVPLPGTDGARAPFFSPDGSSVGFTRSGRLERVSLQGGLPELVCDCNATAGAWGADGSIVFQDQGTQRLMRIPSEGGSPKPLTKTDEVIHTNATFLPDGDTVLFTAGAGTLESRRVAIVSVTTGSIRYLVEGFFPRYLPTGHLLFGRPGALWAAPFDLGRLEITGEARPVLEDVRIENGGAIQFAVAENGDAIYIPRSSERFERVLAYVDRTGREDVLNVPPSGYSAVQISPDGTYIATVTEAADRQEDVWVYDVGRESLLQLTFDARPDLFPVWSADSKEVLFASYRQNQALLSSRHADGTGTASILATIDPYQNWQPWSADSDERLLYVVAGEGTGWDIGMLSLGGEPQRRDLLATPAAELTPRLSPDGRWLAYVSDESGRFDVYVRPFPDVDDGKWRVSRGLQPVWAPSGRELFYWNEGTLWAVTIETTPIFSWINPRALFSGPYRQWQPGVWGGQTYDVSPDGQSFIMIRESEEVSSRSELILVQNWISELQRLVPTP